MMASGADVGITSSEVNLPAGVQRLFTDRRPILFNIMDVFGVGARGERVALGPCTLAMIDPSQSDRVGNYEMQIFALAANAGETGDVPAVQVSISPFSRIVSPAPAVVEVAAHGVKESAHSYTLRFHAAAGAEAFMRDFQVRSRVMRLSLRTAQQNNGALVGKQGSGRGLCYHLKCFALCATVIGLGLFAMHVSLLAKANPSQEPQDLMVVALGDVQTAALYIGERALEAGAQAGAAACKSMTDQCGAVPISQLEQCLTLSESSAKIECTETLVTAAPGTHHQDASYFYSWPSMFDDVGRVDVPLGTDSVPTSDITVDGFGSGVENTVAIVNLEAAMNASPWENTDL